MNPAATYKVRFAETEPVTRARWTIGCYSPPSQFQWQLHERFVRLSTLVLPLQSEIYAWIDGRSWTQGPPRRWPTHPERACNPPCPQYGTNWALPVRKYSATVGLTLAVPDPRPHRRPYGSPDGQIGWQRRSQHRVPTLGCPLTPSRRSHCSSLPWRHPGSFSSCLLRCG